MIHSGQPLAASLRHAALQWSGKQVAQSKAKATPQAFEQVAPPRDGILDACRGARQVLPSTRLLHPRVLKHLWEAIKSGLVSMQPRQEP